MRYSSTMSIFSYGIQVARQLELNTNSVKPKLTSTVHIYYKLSPFLLSFPLCLRECMNNTRKVKSEERKRSVSAIRA